MKIYFASSTRETYEDREMNFQIVQALRRYGKVFSERSELSDTSALGMKPRNSDIYQHEVGLLKDSDVLVAEVSEPSLGVGYEIALMEQMKKPVLCLFRKKEDHHALSVMVAGNEKLMIRQYQGPLDLRRIFREFFK
ncbi:MAG: hypothetical protein A2808_02920 [Candidatus Moranbacteria bacterium RIFCSPHIGHO2_01_FULL_55_24]|nr:MAG: hypothetical protein A2808_02920 [Candidatus Moranbacteria bacterium RIFCSPHIGHO2_01_FULL_55_24]